MLQPADNNPGLEYVETVRHPGQTAADTGLQPQADTPADKAAAPEPVPAAAADSQAAEREALQVVAQMPAQAATSKAVDYAAAQSSIPFATMPTIH